MSTDGLFMSTVFLPACLQLGSVYTLITSGVFQGLSVYSPFEHQSGFSLISSSTTACHPHTKHKISIFFTVIAWFLIPRSPSSQDWSSGQVFFGGEAVGGMGPIRGPSGCEDSGPFKTQIFGGLDMKLVGSRVVLKWSVWRR